jgi:hypothetical protein
MRARLPLRVHMSRSGTQNEEKDEGDAGGE